MSGMNKKTCGTCQFAVEKYDCPTNDQLICRACIQLRLTDDECDVYERDFETLCYKPKYETNYDRLFGTPEKAAKTVTTIAYLCCKAMETDSIESCKECPIYPRCYGEWSLIEWLEEESE